MVQVRFGITICLYLKGNFTHAFLHPTLIIGRSGGPRCRRERTRTRPGPFGAGTVPARGPDPDGTTKIEPGHVVGHQILGFFPVLVCPPSRSPITSARSSLFYSFCPLARSILPLSSNSRRILIQFPSNSHPILIQFSSNSHPILI